jgi:hypothetical protein
MAVISFKEQHQQRRSTYRDGKWTHQRQWQAECDDPDDGTVVAAAAAPPPGAVHPKDGSARLTGLEVTPTNSSERIFTVLAEYSSTGLIGLPANPLDRPPTIVYGSTDATEEYFLDRSTPDPKPVTNSAGDHPESFRERDTGELVLTITTNEETFNPLEMDEIKNTTNKDIVSIDGIEYAPGTLKLSPPTAKKVTEKVEGEGGTFENFTYYEVTWVLKARKDGWDDKLIDVGLNELVPNSDPTKPAKLRPIVDSTNLPVKKPWPLDGHGRKLATPDATPATLTFKPYGKGDWGTYKAFKAESWAA